MACSLRANLGKPARVQASAAKIFLELLPELTQVSLLAGHMACQMLHRVACITNASKVVMVDTTAAPALYVCCWSLNHADRVEFHTYNIQKVR